MPVTGRGPGCPPLQTPALKRQVLRKKGVRVQVPAAWKTGDARLRAHLPLSVPAEVFLRREGTERRDQRRVCRVLHMQTGTVLSAGQVTVLWASPQLHVILDRWWKAGKSPGAGTPEGRVCVF